MTFPELAYVIRARRLDPTVSPNGNLTLRRHGATWFSGTPRGATRWLTHCHRCGKHPGVCQTLIEYRRSLLCFACCPPSGRPSYRESQAAAARQVVTTFRGIYQQRNTPRRFKSP